MRRSKALVERIEAKTVARWCGHDAGGATAAGPSGKDGEEVSRIARGARLLAKLVGPGAGQHGQEGGKLGDIFDEQLGVAGGIEGRLGRLGLCIERFQGIRFEQHTC